MQADGVAVTNQDSPQTLAERAVVAATEHNLFNPSGPTSGIVHVQADSLTGSDRVAHVKCGERSFVAKHAGEHAGLGTDWRTELALYRATASDATMVVPRFVAHSQRQQLIFIEALDQGWQRLADIALANPWSIEICSRVATSLARWHQASQSLTGIDVADPWLLAQVDQGKATEGSDHNPVVRQIVADDSLHESMRAVKAAWVRSHVMHGDVDMKHVMCHPDGSCRLVDWAASGWGDPRWDLAGLLQALRSVEIEQGVETKAHRVAILDAYAERAQSPSTLSEADPTMQAFVAVRLMWKAMQLHESPGGTIERVNAHLAAARAFRSR